MLRVAVVAAGTGIHRGREHEPGGIRQAHRRAGDGHDAVLHRLPEHLEHVLAELGQLVEEQHAAVRQAHLARTRERPAADQAGVADGVVRRPERPPRHQRFPQRQHPRHRVDLGGLQRLVEADLGKDRREAARQHRLPRARRADH